MHSSSRLQHLPRDLEVLAFEAGCEDIREREVDEVEWQGGRVYLHLGARRDAKRPLEGSAGNPQAVTVSSVARRSPAATRAALREAGVGLAADRDAAHGRLAVLAARRFACRLDGRPRPAR